MNKIQYNGYEYHRVDLDEEARQVLARWQPGTTLVTRYQDKPAVVVDGQVYVQGRNMNPNPNGRWVKPKHGLTK